MGGRAAAGRGAEGRGLAAPTIFLSLHENSFILPSVESCCLLIAYSLFVSSSGSPSWSLCSRHTLLWDEDLFGPHGSPAGPGFDQHVSPLHPYCWELSLQTLSPSGQTSPGKKQTITQKGRPPLASAVRLARGGRPFPARQLSTLRSLLH